MQLLCFGDIAFADGYRSEWIWPRVSGFFPSDDTRIIFNWELPIGNELNPIPRTSGPRLLSHLKSPDILSQWAPGFATLATNHILDAGEAGLTNTITQLQTKGFITCGAGRTQEEITRPIIWETEEGKLAITNWVFGETNPDWDTIPGPNCWPGKEMACMQIQDLKKIVDWVIVIVHWSDELFPYPRSEDREIARSLIKAGADAVIGHHPHVVRGLELINGKPVFYSLGNFYFSNIRDNKKRLTYRPAPRNREALSVRFIFSRNKEVKYEPISFWQGKDQTKPDLLNRATHRLNSTSQILARLSGPDYSNWYTSRKKVFNSFEYRLHFALLSKGWMTIFRNRIPITRIKNKS